MVVIVCLTLSFSAPLDKPSGRWGQTLCPIDPQTAILIGGQGARMQFCKDPIWKLCTGKHFTLCLMSADCNILLNMFLLGRCSSALNIFQRIFLGYLLKPLQKDPPLRPALVTQRPMTRNLNVSLCLVAQSIRNGLMMFTS